MFQYQNKVNRLLDNQVFLASSKTINNKQAMDKINSLLYRLNGKKKRHRMKFENCAHTGYGINTHHKL